MTKTFGVAVVLLAGIVASVTAQATSSGYEFHCKENQWDGIMELTDAVVWTGGPMEALEEFRSTLGTAPSRVRNHPIVVQAYRQITRDIMGPALEAAAIWAVLRGVGEEGILEVLESARSELSSMPGEPILELPTYEDVLEAADRCVRDRE